MSKSSKRATWLVLGALIVGLLLGALSGHAGAAREPIAVLGPHPESGKEIKVMAGRYGPYVSDGTTHATLPKGAEPTSVTLDQAIEWIDAKAAKGPTKKKGRRKKS